MLSGQGGNARPADNGKNSCAPVKRNYIFRMAFWQKQEAGSGLKEKPLTGLLLCIAVVAAAHVTYLNNGFVWLDHGDIEQGRALIPLSKWWLAFTGSFAYTGFYRPVVTLVHSLDASLWGIHAPGFHCTNIMLHCAAALAAPFFVASFFPLSSLERCVIILIFGLHPLTMVPAGCISHRSEALLALFTFCAVWYYGRVRASPTLRGQAMLFLSAACACFSKETAFFYLTLFFLLWETQRFVHRKVNPNTAKGFAARFMPAALTAAAALGAVFCFRLFAMPLQWCITPVSLQPLESFGTRLATIGKHLVNLISPLTPVLSDAVPVSGILQPVPILMAVISGLIFFLAIRAGLRSAGTMMILLIAVSLFPALNLLPLPRFYSPHYAYLAVAPLAGGIVFLSRTIRCLKRRQLSLMFHVLVFIWMIIAGISTICAGSRFQSDLTLFAPEVRMDPRFSEGWFYIGNYYRTAGRFIAADNAYDSGLSPAPGVVRFFDRLEFLINMSSIAVQRNELAAADSIMQVAQASASAALQPDIAFIRADIAARRGDYDTVIALLSSNKENLRRPESRMLLANALSLRGQEKEAEEMHLPSQNHRDSVSNSGSH